MLDLSLLSLLFSTLEASSHDPGMDSSEEEIVSKQFRDLLEHVPVGIAIFKSEAPYRVLYHNRHYQSLCPPPFNSRGVTGMYLSDYISQAEANGIFDSFREVVQSKQHKTLYNAAYPNEHGDGLTYWNWSLTPVLAENRVAVLFHVIVDVTKEMVAQQHMDANNQRTTEAFQASEDKLQLVLRGTKTSVYTTDLDLRYTWIYNPHPSFAPDDFIGKRDEDLLPAANVQALIGLKKQVLETAKGTQKQIETEINGEKFVFLVTVEPLRDRNGTLQGLIVVTTDVTEHARTQTALRDAEEKFRVTLMNSPITVAQVDRNLRYTWVYNPHPDFSEEDNIGKRDDELNPGVGSDQLMALKQRVLDTGVEARERIFFQVNDETYIYDFKAEPLLDERGDVIGVTTIAMDITEWHKLEAQSHILSELAVALTSAMTQKQIAEAVLQHAIEALGAAGGTVALLSEDKTTLEITGSLGYPQPIIDKWREVSLDHPTAPISLAVREDQTLWLGSTEERLKFIPATENLSRKEQHEAWAVLPLRVEDMVIGVIGLGFNTQQEFQEPERRLYQTLAGYAAQAIRRVQLTEQLRDFVQVEERQRLARELHDTVKQILFSSSMIAQALPELWKEAPEKARAHVEQLVRLNRAALSETQSVLFEFRPEAITQSPFPELLENLCIGLRGKAEIDVNFVYNGSPQFVLPPDVQVECYRLMQEVCKNIDKHSGATQVDVECSFDTEHFSLRIRDNGIGFDVTQEAGGSMGLQTMRERAEKIGADFEITSQPGDGTQINLALTLDAESSE